MPGTTTISTERRTYTVAEAAALLGISRTTAYECVKTGELQHLRLRRRIVIPAHAINAMLRIDPGQPHQLP